jgi:hypothetical protein
MLAKRATQLADAQKTKKKKKKKTKKKKQKKKKNTESSTTSDFGSWISILCVRLMPSLHFGLLIIF